MVGSLCTSGTMQGGIRIPNAVGPLMVTADLRAGRVICHIDIDAPREGRPTTRVNWLLRQLKQAPDNLRIEAFAMHARGAGAAELLRDVRENPALLVQDPAKELRSFRIALTTAMGSKRGRGRGSFIDSVTDSVNALYSEVVQNLKTWTAAPPKMRQISSDELESPRVASTALSSQDGPEETDPGPTEHDTAASDPAAIISAGEVDPTNREEEHEPDSAADADSLASIHYIPRSALPD